MNNELDPYEKFLRLSEDLNRSVAEENWKEMVRLARDRKAAMKGLMQEEPGLTLTQTLRERKASLIRKILLTNERIRNQVEGKLAEIDRRFSVERQVLSSYGLQIDE